MTPPGVMWWRGAALLSDLNGTLVTAHRPDGRDAVANPGVAVVLSELHRLGAPWAIVTSVSSLVAIAELEAACLPAPAVLITADTVTNGKPAPDGYLAAAAALNARASACLVVEDTRAGIEAGLAAGARVLTVDPHAGPEDERVSAFNWSDVVDIRGGQDDVVLHLR